MKWNLRWVAARQDIWRPTDLLAAFGRVGFNPSLSKVSALWGGTPVTVRLEDLPGVVAGSTQRRGSARRAVGGLPRRQP